MAKLYIDDEEEGLARATSHPRFCAVATDDFFFDQGDDFSPFGNDDGFDTLSELQNWFQSGGGDLETFVAELDASWDLPRPDDLEMASDEALSAWLSTDDMNVRYLLSHANVRIAVAFGQLKITGDLDSVVAAGATRALGWRRLLNARARTENPNWPFGEEELSRIEAMGAVLQRALQSVQGPRPG